MKQEIIVHLEAKDIVRLLRIFTDRDEKEALAFLKERFEKKVEEALKPPCGPETAAAIKAATKLEVKSKKQRD